MPNYRRSREGRTYFFTVVTYQRLPILCLDKSRAALREAIADTRASHPFTVSAWVLLPDHIHCIWELPKGDTNYSTRWGLIKSGFTKRAKAWLILPKPSESQTKHRESSVWQRRFWEHTIRNERDFATHCDYIHYNPVKHDLVRTPRDWPYTTFHRMVKSGMYAPDWCASQGLKLPDGIGGE